MSKSTTEKLTNTIAKWIAADCRPISIVEDQGLQEAFQIMASDPTFQLPSRGTVMKKIHHMYDDERREKEELLAVSCHVALTGDHWTSVSNHNYLGVTAHLIDRVETEVVCFNCAQNSEPPLCRCVRWAVRCRDQGMANRKKSDNHRDR